MNDYGDNPVVGFGSAGGSNFSQLLAGFFAQSESAIKDNLTRPKLASRSRVLTMSSPLAEAAISCLTQGVVGSGLRYSPLPTSRYFEHYEELTAQLSESWELASEFHLLDHNGRLTFGELQAACFRNGILSGDVFLIRRKTGKGFSWRLVEEFTCATPSWMTRGLSEASSVASYEGRYVVDGVELSRSLKPLAYWFCFQPSRSADRNAWERIPAFDRNGLPIVIQFAMIHRGDQYRGIPLLAPLIEVIFSTKAYAEAEVQGALIDACHTYAITSESLNPTLDPLVAITQQALDQPLVPDEKKQKKNDNPRQIPITLDPLGLHNTTTDGLLTKTTYVQPGQSFRLAPGEKIEHLSSNRPNSYYGTFLEVQAKLVGSACRIPYEVLLQSFESSYSASRAALGQFEQTCIQYRKRFVEAVMKPIFMSFCYRELESMGVSKDVLFEKSQMLAVESVWQSTSKPIHIDESKELAYWLDAVNAGLVTRDEAAQALFGHPAVRNGIADGGE